MPNFATAVHPLTWRLAHVPDIADVGTADALDAVRLAGLDWRDVALPSSVQTSSFGLPLDELYRGDNIAQVKWMQGEWWLYSATFTVPEMPAGHEALLRIRGIDYRASIFIDGAKVLDHEGMFRPAEVSLDSPSPDRSLSPSRFGRGGEERAAVGSAGVGSVVVAIHPFDMGSAPYEHLKARYSMGNGWDFAPKIASIGIWEGAELIARPIDAPVSIHAVTRRANVQRADVTVRVRLPGRIAWGTATVSLGGVTTRFPIVDTDDLSLPMVIPSPRLWQPNGSGEPSLTTLTVAIEANGQSNAYTLQTGLRSVERVPCEGQGQEDIALQLVINGRKTFVKGVNWVPLDALPGSITRERYDLFLSQLKDGNVNLIRVWGGGLRERPEFYELCDKFGLMVMQEFPLACEMPSESERFLRLLNAEASEIIADLAPHPCVVLWTGGNEHYHFWDAVDSGSAVMNEALPFVRETFVTGDDNREWRAGCALDHPALTLMGGLVDRLDGGRPYQPTSGMEGQGEPHGIWNWNPALGDHRFRDYASLYEFWLAADQHFYSESSVSSIANLETIREVVGTDATVPTKTDPIWRLHHAFGGAWDAKDDLWLDMPSTETLFGKPKCLDDLVFANQWMQGEGGRFLIEELRRKRGRTCGVIWWGVNEPWPGLAGNALIDWHGRPKLSWPMIANAYRPTILSLRYDNCVARAIKPELWVCHDGIEPFEGSYSVTQTNLAAGTTETLTGRVSCEPDSSAYIKTLPRTRLTCGMRLHVRSVLADASGEQVHANDYFFASTEDAVPFDGASMATMRSAFQQASK